MNLIFWITCECFPSYGSWTLFGHPQTNSTLEPFHKLLEEYFSILIFWESTVVFHLKTDQLPFVHCRCVFYFTKMFFCCDQKMKVMHLRWILNLNPPEIRMFVILNLQNRFNHSFSFHLPPMKKYFFPKENSSYQHSYLSMQYWHNYHRCIHRKTIWPIPHLGHSPASFHRHSRRFHLTHNQTGR